MTPVLFISTIYARAALARTKKNRSLRNGKTELQRLKNGGKKALRIGAKKIGQQGTKNYKRKRNGHRKQKTMRNGAWPLSKD